MYNGTWRSLAAHLLWEQEIVGSNPTVPTKQQHPRRSAAFVLFKVPQDVKQDV
jgi:hypothetical protein